MRHRHSTAIQYYNDVSDFLAAARSALGWIYFVIAAVLAFSCIFNGFFEAQRVRGVSLKGESVSVIAQYRNAEVSPGDVALIHDEDGYYCAKIHKVCDDELVIIKRDGERTIPVQQLEGKVCFVLLPVMSFGAKAEKACADF